MSILVTGLIALLSYATASVLLFKRARLSGGKHQSYPVLEITILVGIVFHGLCLYQQLFDEQGFNFGLSIAFSLAFWTVITLLAIVSLIRPVEILGIVVLPLSTIAIVFSLFLPGEQYLVFGRTPVFTWHFTLAVLAFGLLGMAVSQAIILAFQQHHLKHRSGNRLINALPAIQTMESVLFQLLSLGYLLLTVSLITGVMFNISVSGSPLAFNHHVLLSIVAWIIFTILLAGRWAFGWRGKMAIKFTLGGFIVLMLAYFGSRFVAEVILSA